MSVPPRRIPLTPSAPGRRGILAATGLVALLGSAGCSYLNGGSSSDAGGGDAVQLTFRIWSDDTVAAAYESSFAAFTEKNPGITVSIEQVPWDSYFDTLRTDIAAGAVADAFWVNAYNFAAYADNDDLVDITEELPDAGKDWEDSAVELYTRDGSLWGVPQLIDGSKVLFYNKDLVEAAGIDVESLAWDPTASDDSLRQAARALTVDDEGRTAADEGFDPSTTTQYGFNAAYDFDAILGNFVGSNGGLYQKDGAYVFGEDPRTVEAIEYVVDLVDREHVTPAAADTNADGSYSLTQFQAGKLALFESGAYNLSTIAESTDADWGLAPIPAGPKGRISVTNAIIAAGSAASAHPEELRTLLAWLSTAEGLAPLGEAGAIIPAVRSAQQSYVDFWSAKDIDVTAFTEGLADGTLRNDPVPNAQAASADLESAYHEIFAGRSTDIPAALQEAQDHANDQIAG